jgi:uncharacterized protein
MSGFVLDLSALSQGVRRLRLESEAAGVGLAPEGWAGPVQGDFAVERSADRISVRGRVTAGARLECVRCLAAFELPLDVPFELYADRKGTGSRRDEVELERDDLMSFHDGRRLDFGEQVREALLIELPIAPHCSEGCRGLCPVCGADLNREPCTCPERETAR